MAGIALDQAIPLGRVWSFPKNIVTLNYGLPISTIRAYSFLGSLIQIRKPERWIITLGPKATWYTRADIDRIFTEDMLIPSTPLGS